LTRQNLKKPLHIAVVAPSVPGELFDLLWKGVWSAAFELAPLGVQVDRYETNAHDLTAQKRILTNLLGRPPDVLILAPAHRSAVDVEIAFFSDLQVPVVTFHTDAPGSRRVAYIGTDPAESGALAGEVLGQLMRASGTIASFPGSLETEHLKQRYLAFRKELKNNFPEIKETVSHSGYEGLAEAAEQALRQDRPVSGIYVGCSRSGEVARVAASLGRKIPFVGFDLTEGSQPYLENGMVSALIDENVYHQGYIAVHHAYEALHAKASEADASVPLRASVMLRANCKSREVLEPGATTLENLIRIRTRRSHRFQEMFEDASTRLALLSETDPLTGLLNRTKFEGLLSAAVRIQQRLAILMFGLDGFERNGGWGTQPVNDEALKTVARTLQTLSRTQDHCARITNDEFCILMPGADHIEVSGAREKILAALSKTVIAPLTLNLGIRVSSGAASLPEDATNAEDLLVCADNAMYAHKRAMLSSFLPSTLAGKSDPSMPTMRGSGDGI
jgi:LacI family transcriptional regulator